MLMTSSNVKVNKDCIFSFIVTETARVRFYCIKV